MGAVLRAVSDDDAPVAASSVAQAVTTGKPLMVADALAARIAEAIDDPGTPARDLAALSKRLTDLMQSRRDMAAEESQEAHYAAVSEDEGLGDV